MDAGTIAVVADGDFMAHTYATGRLAHGDGYRDQLTLFRLHHGALARAEVEVSNSVTAPPEVMGLSPDARTAFVLERLGQRAPGMGRIADLPPGRRLSAVRLSGPGTPRVVATTEVVARPEALALSPDGTRVAVVANGPAGSVLQILAYADHRFGSPATFELAEHVDALRARPAALATNVQWHPSGRFLAVNFTDRDRVAFFELVWERRGPHIRACGQPVRVGRDPFVGRFSPDGRHYFTADWGRDLTADTLEGRLPTQPSAVSVIRLAHPAGDASGHRKVGAAGTDLSSEGLAVSPDGDLVATVNMRNTPFPPGSPRHEPGASVTLLEFDPRSGTLRRAGDYPLPGLLPEGAAFDLTGEHLLATVFEYDGGRLGGGVEVFRVARGQRPSLAHLGRVPVPHGAHHVAVGP